MDKTSKRTYMSTTPSRHITTIEPIKAMNAMNLFYALGRGLLGFVRYILFTTVCGLAFYFLLRSV